MFCTKAQKRLLGTGTCHTLSVCHPLYEGIFLLFLVPLRPTEPTPTSILTLGYPVYTVTTMGHAGKSTWMHTHWTHTTHIKYTPTETLACFSTHTACTLLSVQTFFLPFFPLWKKHVMDKKHTCTRCLPWFPMCSVHPVHYIQCIHTEKTSSAFT